MPSTAIRVTAQSAAQSTASASASVTLTQPAISISLSPLNVSVPVGQTQQFSASVSGTTNTAVNWLVSGVLGGNSTVGTISASGTYTAPKTVPATAVKVSAQSAVSSAISATATVTVTQPTTHSVTLSWTPSSSSVMGYYVYRGAQATGPFSKLNSSPDAATVYTDSTVVSGHTYYYVTTSVNSSGVESGYSNVAQAVVP
jgi:hypothetical protein